MIRAHALIEKGLRQSSGDGNAAGTPQHAMLEACAQAWQQRDLQRFEQMLQEYWRVHPPRRAPSVPRLDGEGQICGKATLWVPT